jgi:succinate-semialdehyde dehydrogenase/glutarate-semialdehyde dehydrogenase
MRKSVDDNQPFAAAGDRASVIWFEPSLWINGEWRKARDGRTTFVKDPATGEVITEVPCAGKAEACEAVDAAAAAFTQWRRQTPAQRADILWRIYNLLLEHREALALLGTAEGGTPLGQSRAFVDYAAGFFRFFAEEARRIYGRTIPHPDPKRRLRVDYYPVGVVGAITPWNVPLAAPAKKVAPAIAAGCTMVLKPASQPSHRLM